MTTRPYAHLNEVSTRHQSRVLTGFTIIAVLMTLVLFTYRLGYYPAPWFDEGTHLRVAKNYALNGIYADYSSEGIRYYGPAIGVGPTVMLPIAAVYNLFGVSIPLARTVIVIYGLFSLLALYALGRQMLPPLGAVLVVALVVLAPGIEFVYNTRTVLGEVPGLFFLLAGLWLWLRPGKRGLFELILVGLLLGLACITKNQYAFVILPSLLVCWLADLVWYRRRGGWYFVVPGIIAGAAFAGWLFFILVALGDPSSMASNLETLRKASAGAFLVLQPTSIQRALSLLVDGSVYGAAVIPAVLYGLLLALKRDERGQQLGILLIFVLVGLAFFIVSIAWPRYAFAPLVLAGILVVKLMADLSSGFQLDWHTLRDVMRGDGPVVSSALTILVIGWLLIALVMPLVPQTYSVIRRGDDAAYHAADYLKANIPLDAVIETWEPELGVLTDHRYHFPPQLVLAEAVAHRWTSETVRGLSYDFRDYVDPDYVVVGPFAKFTVIYPPEKLTGYELINSVYHYDIYRRVPVN